MENDLRWNLHAAATRFYFISRCQWLQQKRVKAYSRVVFFCVSLLHPHTLFSLNHQLNCIADFFCFHCICLLPCCCCCWYALFLLEFMQFLLCRSRELSAFISRFLSSLPAEYFAMFSCSFFRYFGSLVLASFSGRDIDQIFAQPQFYNHDYFPAKQQQREAENVNKLVSDLLCCTPHSPPASLLASVASSTNTDSFRQLLLPPIQFCTMFS